MITNYFFFPRPVSSRVQAGASQTDKRETRRMGCRQQARGTSTSRVYLHVPAPASRTRQFRYKRSLQPQVCVRALRIALVHIITGRPDCKLPSISQVISLRTADGMGGDLCLVQSMHSSRSDGWGLEMRGPRMDAWSPSKLSPLHCTALHCTAEVPAPCSYLYPCLCLYPYLRLYPRGT